MAQNDNTTDPQDYDVRSYQDELDTNPEMTDSATHEQTDDPVETLGVPADELASELEKRDLGDPDTTDDMRSEIEDLDEDMETGDIGKR